MKRKVETIVGQIKKSRALPKKWTESELVFLKNNYTDFAKTGRTKELADLMGVKVYTIHNKIQRLGMSKLAKREYTDEQKASLSEKKKERNAKFGTTSPKPGYKWSEESKKNKSKQQSSVWANPESKLNSEQYRTGLSKRMSENLASGIIKPVRTPSKKGWCWIAGRYMFFRSSWEPNIAAYLQFQKEAGLFSDWGYETDTFWFEKIKRGVRSYKPDFKITRNDGTFYFIEVKGYMDKQSKTKLKRMRIYHPDIEVQLLDTKRYKEISKQSSLYKYWGQELKPKEK